MTINLDDFKQRMQAGIDVFAKELSGLRAGRASINLLDPIKVDAYGSYMPIAQVGTVTAPEPRLLVVQVWDKGIVKKKKKAIRESSLGVSPSADGQLVRVVLPDLNQERRQELSKIAGKYAEEAKISVRNVRREGNELVKKMEKDKEISEDVLHRLIEEMQELTDNYIKKIDDMLAVKQKDIMHV
ncbi:MAG: ribosome recycling factor [Proteobacteria bacterium]|nr:ribosome recycling factor [Pseudomonadota bacterium]